MKLTTWRQKMAAVYGEEIVRRVSVDFQRGRGWSVYIDGRSYRESLAASEVNYWRTQALLSLNPVPLSKE